MVGQKELLNQIDTLISNKKFPKFSIIIGEQGYGKHTICKYIAEGLGLDYLLFNNKIDDLRQFIDVISTQASPYIYVLQDGDSMSLGAKNSILKIVEEVPSQAYVILLIDNRNSALATLISRAFVFELNNYSKEELVEYCNLKGYSNPEQLILVANCPGELDIASKVDVNSIISFAEKLIDNVKYASLPNVMKVASKINGTDDDGYDLRLFLNAMYSVMVNRLENERNNSQLKIYRDICLLISEYSYKLRMRSSNLKYIVDSFIINLWRITG